jgi:hypothetical protein
VEKKKNINRGRVEEGGRDKSIWPKEQREMKGQREREKG